MNKRLDVLVCGGGACISSHSHELKNRLVDVIAERGLADEINLVETGCMGPCELGPVMVVYPDGSFQVRGVLHGCRDVGRGHEHLRRHTAAVEARPAELVLLDHRGVPVLQPGTEHHVPAAATHDDQVVLTHERSLAARAPGTVTRMTEVADRYRSVASAFLPATSIQRIRWRVQMEPIRPMSAMPPIRYGI